MKIKICPKCSNIIKSENDIHYCHYGFPGRNIFDFIADIPPVAKYGNVSFFEYLKGAFSRSDRFNHGQSCDNIPEFLLNRSVDTYRICLIGMRNSGKTCFKLMLKEALNAEHIKSDLSYDDEYIKENILLPKSTPDTEAIEPEYLKFNYKGKSKAFIIYDLPGIKFENLSNATNGRWTDCMTSSDLFFIFLEAKNILNYTEEESRKLCDTLYAMFSQCEEESLIADPKVCYIFSKSDTLSDDEMSNFEKELKDKLPELHKKIYKSESDKYFFVSSLGNDCQVSEVFENSKKLIKKGKPYNLLSSVDWFLK